MHYKGFELDDFQVKASEAIDRNHSVIVSAPTGSGKTLIADYIINRDVRKGVKIIYTAPIKALSNQKYKEFSKEYGEDRVGLLTGDIVINPQGTILIMTTEIYRNMVLTKDPLIQDISYLIFDEIHYINDIERGYIWEESIIFSPARVRFLCLSATIPNAQEFANWIHAIKRHRVEVITHHHRIVPLEHLFFDADMGISTLSAIEELASLPEYHTAVRQQRRRGGKTEKKPRPSHLELVRELVAKDELPCLFFNFSRMSCQQKAIELARKNIFPFRHEIPLVMQKKLRGSSKELLLLPTTRLLRETLPKGIGFHHAGLLPILKEVVEDLFEKGLIRVLYTTETFAVGLNMPAKTVCFESLRKFDGFGFRYLNSKEYFQMAGRAGRRGIDTKGTVISMLQRSSTEFSRIKKLTARDTVPIKSQFRLSVNTVLNMIHGHSPQEIDTILCHSFYTYQKYREHFDKRRGLMHHAFDNMVKKLKKLGYVRGWQLTDKGLFASKIFVDEITFTELFQGNFTDDLDEYQILLLLAALVYEARERTQFHRRFRDRRMKDVQAKLRRHSVLSREERFREMHRLTALVYPLMEQQSFFDILQNTSLSEGDIIRFFLQILDRIGQLRKAAQEHDLAQKLDSCSYLVKSVLKEVMWE